jgi:nitroimidazol reductase NimA-like FMN-containing flavoprotein (pyridoxamine 5'-phosphate oxidase superfamily)
MSELKMLGRDMQPCILIRVESELNEKSQLRRLLKDLFATQLLAVLAAQTEGQPYTSLVAFSETDELKHLLFATSRNTHKYANIIRDPRVAMLVDNRSNRDSDFRNAVAVTAIGKAEEIHGLEKDRLAKLYLAKHPYLEEFVSSPDTALFRVRIHDYKVVSDFQNVVGLEMGD